jgi:hypothetical protein
VGKACLDQGLKRRPAHYIAPHEARCRAVLDQLAQQQAPQIGFFLGFTLVILVSFTAKYARNPRFECLLKNSPQSALVLFGR